MQKESEGYLESMKIIIEYQPKENFLWSDITALLPFFSFCFEKISTAQRKSYINKILGSYEWVEHYNDKTYGRRVLSESTIIEYKHELLTAICLAKVNYDVIFAPDCMFERGQKRFDIFLIRDTIILKADLKSISSKNPDTIAKRIKEGTEQASRIVLHVNSDIEKKNLINGLKSGVERNVQIKEILLFYKHRFYRLPKNLILSNRLLKIIQ